MTTRALSPLSEAMRDEVLLAYAINGQPLPPQHGFPLRLVVPGLYGMTHVKWLRTINVIGDAFDGWQQTEAYHLDPETPVSRMLPRSLLVPPGIPDFLTRGRRLAAGPCVLEGRAWSGPRRGRARRVSTDGGRTWGNATLAEPVSDFAWRGWTFRWDALPGEHVLSCRATDATGRTQPDDGAWNEGGYCNNAVQRVRIVVS